MLVAVHKLGFDAFGARVDDLAVSQIEEEEVVEGLAAMARMDGVGGFELKESASVDEDVEEVGLREGLVGDGDLEFEFGAGKAVGQFTLIDAFVEEAAEVVVDRIDVLHDLVGEVFELLLRGTGSFNGAVDGHAFDIPWVDRDRPGARLGGWPRSRRMIATGDADIEGLANAVVCLGCCFGKSAKKCAAKDTGNLNSYFAAHIFAGHIFAGNPPTG